jgi:hypothetical protein
MYILLNTLEKVLIVEDNKSICSVNNMPSKRKPYFKKEKPDIVLRYSDA